jgi:hypothetical protein
MNRVTRLFALLALTLALSLGAPGAALAASCTDAYGSCLNDAWASVNQTMSDLECGAEWTGCVIGKLKFW